MRMLVVTRLIFRYAEPHSMASPGRVDLHKGKINSPRVRGSVFLWIMSLKVRSGAGLNGHKCHNRSQKLGFGRGSRAAEAAVRSKDTGGTSLSAQGPRTRRAMFKWRRQHRAEDP